MRPSRLLTALIILFSASAHAVAQDGIAHAAPGGAPSAVASGARQELAAVRRDIEEANRRMVETFKKGDYLGVARVYLDDATIYYPGKGKVHGREAIDKYWTSIKGGKDWKLEVIEVGGDRETVYQVGRSSFTSERDGKESTNVADFLVIWKRQKDGQYKIYIDFYN